MNFVNSALRSLILRIVRALIQIQLLIFIGYGSLAFAVDPSEFKSGQQIFNFFAPGSPLHGFMNGLPTLPNTIFIGAHNNLAADFEYAEVLKFLGGQNKAQNLSGKRFFCLTCESFSNSNLWFGPDGAFLSGNSRLGRMINSLKGAGAKDFLVLGPTGFVMGPSKPNGILVTADKKLVRAPDNMRAALPDRSVHIPSQKQLEGAMPDIPRSKFPKEPLRITSPSASLPCKFGVIETIGETADIIHSTVSRGDKYAKEGRFMPYSTALAHNAMDQGLGMLGLLQIAVSTVDDAPNALWGKPANGINESNSVFRTPVQRALKDYAESEKKKALRCSRVYVPDYSSKVILDPDDVY